MSEAQDTDGVEAGTRAAADVDAMRKRWLLVAGLVAWLAVVIGPAISFDVELALSSDAGAQFKAYFPVLTGVLFLLGWRFLDRIPLWALVLLVVVALASFVAYTLGKSAWTCSYFPNIYSSRFTMGTELLPQASAVLAGLPAGSPCEEMMSPFGGDALRIWEGGEVYRRFLMLFGFYSLAWLSIALALLGALRYSLRSVPA